MFLDQYVGDISRWWDEDKNMLGKGDRNGVKLFVNIYFFFKQKIWWNPARRFVLFNMFGSFQKGQSYVCMYIWRRDLILYSVYVCEIYIIYLTQMLLVH